MTYGNFAYLYDALMEDVDYTLWVDYIERMTKQHSNRSMSHLLDLACGTGELSIRLASAGYEVVGIDLSEDMLTVANAKAEAANQRITWYQQDMTQLEGLQTFDIIVIFCDSLNYLQSSEEVRNTFRNVYHLLRDDGLFMFDVHSTHKMQAIFMDQTFAINDEEISYIWNCFPGEFPNSVEHELTFFVKNEDKDVYQRVDETHFQRTFPIDEYQKMLKETGFEIIDVSGDFDQTVNPESERIFFTLKK